MGGKMEQGGSLQVVGDEEEREKGNERGEREKNIEEKGERMRDARRGRTDIFGEGGAAGRYRSSRSRLPIIATAAFTEMLP
jgi:hypothetical protein